MCFSSYYEKFANGKVVCIDDEIPFELPDSWLWERWGNLSQSIQYGYNAPAEEFGDIRMVRISDIQNGEVQWETVPYCHINKNEIENYLLRKNDILFARTGGTVGKSFLVKESPYPAIYAGYLIRTRYSSMLLPQYMKLFMESQLYWEQLKNGTIATAQPNCNGKTLSKMILPIPPYKEQVRIADKLKEILSQVYKYDKAQSKQDNLNTQILSLLKKSILQEAIQGRLVPQNLNDEPASALLQRIKEEKQKLVKEGKLKKKDVVDSIIFKGDDNKYFEKKGREIVCIDEEIPFEIPDTWIWTRLSNVCHITNGFTPLRTEDSYWHNGTINWFTVEDLREQGEYISYTKQKITKEATSKERIVRAGSTLLCCTASVGQCAFSKIPLTTNQQFNALTVKQEHIPVLNDDFLFLFAKTLEDKLHKLSGKTTFEFVSVKKVCNILIPIPPLSEQIRIVNVANKALASIMSRSMMSL